MCADGGTLYVGTVETDFLLQHEIPDQLIDAVLVFLIQASYDQTGFQDIRTLELAIADIALSRLEDGSWQPDDPLCFPSLLSDLVRSLGRGELGLLDGPSTAD